MESFWVKTAIGAINAISFVCDVISFPVYLFLQKPWRRRQLARRVKVRIQMTATNHLRSLMQRDTCV